MYKHYEYIRRTLHIKMSPVVKILVVCNCQWLITFIYAQITLHLRSAVSIPRVRHRTLRVTNLVWNNSMKSTSDGAT